MQYHLWCEMKQWQIWILFKKSVEDAGLFITIVWVDFGGDPTKLRVERTWKSLLGWSLRSSSGEIFLYQEEGKFRRLYSSSAISNSLIIRWGGDILRPSSEKYKTKSVADRLAARFYGLQMWTKCMYVSA